MRTGLKKSVWIGCGLLALCVSLWGQSALRVSAAAVTVSQVYVTVCGDGVAEGAEECDPGKRCSNSVACTADVECAGIGDNLCSVRAYGTCTATCQNLPPGSRPPVTTVTLTEITARPEQRYSGNGNNFDTEFYFTVFGPDNLVRQPVYQHPFPLLSNASGVASPYVILPNSVASGVYDVILKSKSHLAKLQNNAYFQVGDNSLNFTNADNGVAIGSVTLTAGDLDGAGNSSITFGDNVINAVDISVLLGQIGSSDSSGNSNRANLNQDGMVDQSDLNILLGNLDKEGDK